MSGYQLSRTYRVNRPLVPYAAGGGLLGAYGPTIGRGAMRVGRSLANRGLGAVKRWASSESRQSSARQSRVNSRRTALRGGTNTVSASAFKGRQIDAGGGGESKSFHSYVKKKKNWSALKMLGPNSVNRSSGSSFATTQGLQSAVNIGSYFNADDITNIFTSVGQTSTAANSAKVLLESCHSEIILTNAETTNSHLTIYDVISREDSGSLDVSPAATFLAGMVDQSGGFAADATIPGSTPYNNPRFLASYKILRSTPVILSPGQTHTHKVHYAPNVMFNRERLIRSGVASGGYGGVTCWTFMIQHGTPVHDAVTETAVTIGASKIDYVLLESIKFRAMLFNYSAASVTTALSTSLVGEQMQENAPADLPDTS